MISDTTVSNKMTIPKFHTAPTTLYTTTPATNVIVATISSKTGAKKFSVTMKSQALAHPLARPATTAHQPPVRNALTVFKVRVNGLSLE